MPSYYRWKVYTDHFGVILSIHQEYQQNPFPSISDSKYPKIQDYFGATHVFVSDTKNLPGIEITASIGLGHLPLPAEYFYLDLSNNPLLFQKKTLIEPVFSKDWLITDGEDTIHVDFPDIVGTIRYSGPFESPNNGPIYIESLGKIVAWQEFNAEDGLDIRLSRDAIDPEDNIKYSDKNTIYSLYFNHSPRHVTPYKEIRIFGDRREKFLREAKRLPHVDTHNLLFIIKDQLTNTVTDLQTIDMTEGTQEQKQIHYAKCKAASLQSNRAFYLSTLQNVLECLIETLPHTEAWQIDENKIDSVFVWPISLALDVIWDRTFRLSSIYPWGLPNTMTVKEAYGKTIDNPDSTKTDFIRLPNVDKIEMAMQNWCDAIRENRNMLIPSSMTDQKYAQKLRDLFLLGNPIEEENTDEE